MPTATYRNIYFLFFCLFLISNVSGQNRDNYSLLWEIEHKDTSKKSFVFGTAHLKDKRVFDFSDALIPSMESTEAFALEIHPDSILSGMSRELFTKDYDSIMKKVLSDKEYEQLNNKFIEVTQKPLDSFSFKHPILLQGLLEKEKESDGEGAKSTFLDGYLYKIAKSMGKDIYGLEKIEDQFPAIDGMAEDEQRELFLDLLNFNQEYFDDVKEDIIQLYLSGDVEKLIQEAGKYDTEKMNLVKRNHVMVASLERIMKEKSIFSAVGAAHLGGEEGVVTLLRNKGYTVNRVVSEFTGKSNDYQIKPNIDGWHVNEDLELGYRLLTPAAPIPIDIKGLQMNISRDVVSGGSFFYMVLDLRDKPKRPDFDFIEFYLKQQTEGDTTRIVERSIIVKNDINFTEAIYQSNSGPMRMQMALHNDILYSFFSQNTLAELKSDYTNAFFDSVEIGTATPKIIDNEWKIKIDTIGAFSVSLPGKVTDLSREVENPYDTEEPYELTIYSAQDVNTNTTYLLRFNDQPTGYYLQDEAATYTEFREYFESKDASYEVINEFLENDNKVVVFKVILSGFHILGKIIIRGNRTYLLMAQNGEENKEIHLDDPFLKSFSLRDYYKKEQDTTINLENFSVLFPKKIIATNEDLENDIGEYSLSKTVHGTRAATGGVYSIEYTKFKDYFRTKSRSEFYDLYAEAIREWNDTIQYQKDITIAGKPAREVLYANSNTNVVQKFQILLDNKGVYLFGAYLGNNELNDSISSSFFNSITQIKEAESFDLYGSKAALILKNLKSQDSTTFQGALNSFDYHEFDKDDLALLLKGLDYTYSDDSLYYGAKNMIIRDLASIGDKQAVTKLKSIYLNEKTRNVQKLKILETLPSIKTENAYPTYFSLLEKHPPKRIARIPFNVTSGISDSTEVFMNNIDRVMELLEIDDYRDHIVSNSKNILFSDSIEGGKIKKYGDKLLSYFRDDYRQYRDTLVRAEKQHINFLLILDYINIAEKLDLRSETIKNTLSEIMTDDTDQDWLKTKSIVASISLGFKVPSKILEAKLNENYSKYFVMKALAENGHIKKIPSSYLEPLEFAKISLNEDLGNSDAYPETISLLGTIEENSKEYYVFSFQYYVEGKKYICVAEIKTPDAKDMAMNTLYYS